MTKNRASNICDVCYEYVEDCACGEHDPRDEEAAEADDWYDKQQEDKESGK